MVLITYAQGSVINAHANISGGARALHFGPKGSEYDQEIPQSHTAEQPTAPRRRATEHQQPQDITKTQKQSNPLSFSASSLYLHHTLCIVVVKTRAHLHIRKDLPEPS